MSNPLTLDIAVTEVYKYKVARLGQTMSHKLAMALANYAGKKSASDATIEDLLTYLPMRYEDRSNLAAIRDLKDGMEASLELYVKIAGGYQVRNKRTFGRSKLFIFEVSATDPAATGRPVVVWWFVSGPHAHNIVNYYTKRLTRDTHFITFGRWEWDSRRGTYALRLHKPADELELLAGSAIPPKQAKTLDANAQNAGSSDAEEFEVDTDPTLAAIHVGRRVPVYRKLGDFRSQRLREIIHGLLETISDENISETFPSDLSKRQHLIGRAEALRKIHFPSEDAPLTQYEQARSPAHLRLIFEDFFWLAFGLVLKRGQRIKESK